MLNSITFTHQPPTDEACNREQHEQLAIAPAPRMNVPMALAATCPGCDSHNVTDPTGPYECGDCGLTDNPSAFLGGGMTANARYRPSKFANQRVAGDARKVRAFTISGNVD